ncbi:unnamed protein product [Calypogeia fissa]
MRVPGKKIIQSKCPAQGSGQAVGAHRKKRRRTSNPDTVCTRDDPVRLSPPIAVKDNPLLLQSPSLLVFSSSRKSPPLSTPLVGKLEEEEGTVVEKVVEVEGRKRAL